MHARKRCPGRDGGYCTDHRWPPEQARLARERAAPSRLTAPADDVRETARRPSYKWSDAGKRDVALRRSSSTTDAVAFEIAASEINAAVQRLANEMAQQRTRSRYDGRQVIADRKKERRKLIGDYVRHGMNSL